MSSSGWSPGLGTSCRCRASAGERGGGGRLRNLLRHRLLWVVLAAAPASFKRQGWDRESGNSSFTAPLLTATAAVEVLALAAQVLSLMWTLLWAGKGQL